MLTSMHVYIFIAFPHLPTLPDYDPPNRAHETPGHAAEQEPTAASGKDEETREASDERNGHARGGHP